MEAHEFYELMQIDVNYELEIYQLFLNELYSLSRCCECNQNDYVECDAFLWLKYWTYELNPTD